jgi:hypothetical protein
MSIDLNDLLHAAADRVDASAPELAPLTKRIHRRRSMRAGAAAFGTLAVAGGLVVAGAQLSPAPRSAPPAEPKPSEVAVTLPTVVPGAAPGTCGWEVGAAGADGLAVDGSDSSLQLAVQSARPSDPGTKGIQVETAVVGVAAAVPELISEPTLMLARDGVVVAREQMGAGALAAPSEVAEGSGTTSQLWGLGIDAVTCGPTATDLPDGTYQLWAIQSVEDGDGAVTTLLGGGQDVAVVGGRSPSSCGADVSSLPTTMPGVELEAHTYSGVLPAALFPGVDPTRRHLGASIGFTLTAAASRTGNFASTIYLADDTGRIVVNGVDPTIGQVVGIQSLADSDGGDWETTAQLERRCDDGAALKPGTYRAFVVVSIDQAGGQPGTVHLVAESKPVVVPAP